MTSAEGLITKKVYHHVHNICFKLWFGDGAGAAAQQRL